MNSSAGTGGPLPACPSFVRPAAEGGGGESAETGRLSEEKQEILRHARQARAGSNLPEKKGRARGVRQEPVRAV